MGNSVVALHKELQGIKVHPDVDSPTCPGEKSVLSDPIPKNLCDDPKQMFEELIVLCKANVPIFEIPFFKEISEKQIGEREWEVKIILDGKLRKKFGKQESEEDYVCNWYKVYIDRENLEMRGEDIEDDGTPEGKSKGSSRSLFVMDKETDSFRVESWAVNPEGKRFHGERWANYVEFVHLRPILAIGYLTQTKMQFNVDSPSGEGKSTMSGDLGEYFPDGPDELFMAFLTLFKQDTLLLPGGSVDYTEDEGNAFTAENSFDMPDEKGNKSAIKFTICRTVDVDEEKRLITVRAKIVESGVPYGDEFYQFHEEPLRVEFWAQRPSGKREPLAFEVLEFRCRLDRLILERSVTKEVQTLDEKNFYF
mmetsp:Transcript_62969/g.195307  ORF Transcript_62969/g.195307 Transcript_62969/m.195307 type:complete len:365 (-) Transcript_62969:30-1124(-)